MRGRRDFILIIVRKLKQPSEQCQRFHFNSSEVKQGSERNQRFHFNSSEVKHHSDLIF